MYTVPAQPNFIHSYGARKELGLQEFNVQAENTPQEFGL
jgi:hypothetical protein